MIFNIETYLPQQLDSIKKIQILTEKETDGEPSVSYFLLDNNCKQHEIDDEEIKNLKNVSLKIVYTYNKDTITSILKIYSKTEHIHSDLIKQANINKNTIENKNKILNSVYEKSIKINNKPDIVYGSNNLIYYAVYNNKSYIKLLRLSLLSLTASNNKTDVLIITDKPTFKQIKTYSLPFKNIFFHITPTPNDGVEASINKINIFKYKNINKYQNILYLDCDIIINKNIDYIFENIKSNILYTVAATFDSNNNRRSFVSPIYGFSCLTSSFDEEMFQKNQLPFNAGQFLFKNSSRMQQHFKNVQWFVKNWCGEYFFEQGFMNYYFCKAALTNYNHLENNIILYQPNLTALVSEEILKAPAIHLMATPLNGELKVQFIKKYYPNLVLCNKPVATVKDYICYPFQKILKKIIPQKKDKNIVVATNSAFNLIKTNIHSSYPNTPVGKHSVLKKLNNLYKNALTYPIASKGTKNLIYYTIAGKEEWIEVLRLSLESLTKQLIKNFDVLIITSEIFKEKIEQLHESKLLNIHYMLVEEPVDGVEASLNKLSIYKWSKIKEYNKVLFLDCDTLVVNDLSRIFNLEISGDTLYTAWGSDYTKQYGYGCFEMPFHSLSMFNYDDIKRMKEKNQQPFNAGQFLFVSSEQMLKHFENVDWLATEWPGEFFFEQAFMSHYFCSNILTNSTVIDNLVSLTSIVNRTPIEMAKNMKDVVIYHFIGNSLNGTNKIEFIKTFLSYANI